MITISLCMIVKDEETVLARCLACLQNLVDEMIIVDTGSTDSTKEIAQKFTTQVYDFSWNGDFAEARNFAFSKAKMDYIYSADADEVIDELNQKRFLQLKMAMLPEIEMVQMIYLTDMKYNTTENFIRDTRPKLFKRLRTFHWVEPVHEMVNMEPIVYDSDVEIKHLPITRHQKRDFSIFENTIEKVGGLSERLTKMYARELYLSGAGEDLAQAVSYFWQIYEEEIAKEAYQGDRIKMACGVLSKYAYLNHNDIMLLKIGLQDMSGGGSAEVCMQLGNYFFDMEDFVEAKKWYRYAAFWTESYLDVHSSGDDALLALAKTMQCLKEEADEVQMYMQKAREWKLEHGFVEKI